MLARRDKIFFGILAITVLGALALSLLLGWYIWRESVGTEEQRLQQLSQRLGEETEQAIIDARNLLETLNERATDPCNTTHLAMMQEVAIARPYIRAIGYWRAAERLCGAGFIQGISFTPPKASRIYNSGVIAWWPSETTEVGGVQLFLMRFGHHDVVIDPRLLLNVDLLEGQMAGLWVERLPMITTPPNAIFPPLESLKQGMTVNQSTGQMISRFSLGTLLPIDIVAIQPMSEFWKRYLPTLITAGISALLLIPLWVFAVVRYSRQHLSLAAELRDAITRNKLRVNYQPIVDMSNGRCLGAESLARWTRDNGEVVGPDIFIPIAEEAGLATDLARAMLQGILRELGDLLKQCPDLSINLNLSAQDFQSDRLFVHLETELKTAGLATSAIKLEITERALVDSDSARQRIRTLRRQGHLVAIDDFGTGYSSLSYLESFELDALKIDKSFVDAIENQAVTSSVIVHVIEMAKSLNLDIIAEGVECDHQADWLLSQGVRLGQGYLFSRPLTAHQFIDFHQKYS
ncbi:MAG: cyclic diguanylate phosphodiesterase [Porticoccus sp.]|uniref:EAL domain-containing protein n=1 Tax=Porticoccus hydrocarbonoclasticus TaxID=1073414 RepID=UPI0005662B53|nr:EAL domain-containing protein [Porticoccus hydrocarbonoclasticus]MBG57245.1 cyclic diguanylate phosphodiesterase [Porticoccus sp.]|tara:strand:+ start:1701 stop:3260 length:1560 start_codon:yes stop_codon:yes gene_type:complete